MPDESLHRDENKELITKIINLINQSELQKALEEIQIIKSNNESIEINLKLDNLKSQILNLLGDFKIAAELAKNSYQTAESNKLTELMVSSSIELSNALWRIGDANSSLKVVNNAMTLIKSASDNKALLKFIPLLLNHKGAAYLIKNDYDMALKYLEESLELRKNSPDSKDEAMTMNTLGVIYMNKGDIDKALEYYTKSYDILEKLEDLQSLPTVINNIGIIFRQKGKFTEAMEYYKRSLELREKLGNKQNIAHSLNNIGNLYWSMGKWLQNY
jgi:tetratricopeptide (TPR) repeat protein